MILLDKQAKSPLTHVNLKYKVHSVPAQTIARKKKSSLRKAVAQLVNSQPGLHKLWYPGIRDMSTWSKFGAHGEHGDVFLFSNLGAL